MQAAALLVIFLLLFAAIVVIGWPIARRSKPRYRRPWRPPPPTGAAGDYERDLLAAKQLRAISDAPFQKKRILNYSEYLVFRVIENEVMTLGRGHRAFPQINLGEILASTDKEAFLSINSKRVDMLIVDGGGWPVVAVEYQGEGHYQGTAIARDTIKRKALQKAGVGYLEIFRADSDTDIRGRLREHLAKN